MAFEPEIPITEGDLPQDPVKTDEGTKSQEGTPDTSKPGEGAGSETPTVTEEQYNKLIEGWREEREELTSEVESLKKAMRSGKLTDDEEDELDGLDEDERVEKKIEIRQRKEKELEKAELARAKSEIRFYERTSKEFADNKAAILKTARDYECTTLKQAIAVWRGLDKDKSDKDKAYHEKRKLEADGKNGGKGANGKTEVKPYDAKSDSNKSFGQLFKEGGVN